MKMVCSLIIAFHAIVWLSSEAVAQEDASSWLRQQLLNLQRIRSIEFTATRRQDLHSMVLPGGAPIDAELVKQASSDMTMKYAANGNCLRVEIGSGQNIIAYDGVMLRTLRDNGRAFGEVEGLPDGPIVAFSHPIMWTFRWARPLQSYGDISVLQDEANWQSIIESVRELNNGLLEITQLSANDPGYVYELERGADGKIAAWTAFKLPRRTPEGRVTVMDGVTLTDTDQQEIWIPTEVSYDVGAAGNVVIDPATLKVNHKIDADVFVLSSFEARELLPVSDPRFTTEPRTGPSPQGQGMWWTVVIVNLVGAFFTLLYLYFRRNARR